MARAKDYSRYYLIPWPESQEYIIGYDLYDENADSSFDAVLGPEMSVLVSEEIFNREILKEGSRV